MVTPTALVASTTRMAMTHKNTYKCKAMSLLKDQPKGCKKEISVKKRASSTKSIETKHIYDSLISMTLEEFKDLKPKTN